MIPFFNALFSVLRFLCSVLKDGLYLLFDLFERTNGHHAHWGHEYHLGNSFNRGLLFSRSARLTRKASYENLLIVGGTGSGKTSKFLIRNLLAMDNNSWIINDPSKELYTSCSGYLEEYFDIKILNPSDSCMSSGYNILSRIKTTTDVQRLVDLLTQTSLSSGNADPFWRIKANECLGLLVRLTLYQEEQYRNMSNVVNLLNHLIASPETVDQLIVETEDKQLLLEYKALISTSEKTLQSVLSSAKAAIQVFDDPEVAKVTAHDSIRFESLRERPTIVFLHNSVATQEYYKNLNSIIIQQFYEYILGALPSKNDLDIFIMLEEASSFYVPVLPLALANCRKYKVGTIVAVQSLGQLEKLYSKDAQNIVNNCITKIYLPGLTSIETLREIQTLSGTCIVKDHKGVESTRPLITIDEARILDKKRTLILHSNTPIIKGRSQAFYKVYSEKKACKMPSIDLRGDIPDEPIPLITNQVFTDETEEEPA